MKIGHSIFKLLSCSDLGFKPGTLLLLFVDFHFCEQNRAKTKVISGKYT